MRYIGMRVSGNEVWEDDFGTVLQGVHNQNKCNRTSNCPLHRQSDHNMRSFKQRWRTDAGFFERVCEHGVGHPDPDDRTIPILYLHGCDGCCASRPTKDRQDVCLQQQSGEQVDSPLKDFGSRQLMGVLVVSNGALGTPPSTVGLSGGTIGNWRYYIVWRVCTNCQGRGWSGETYGTIARDILTCSRCGCRSWGLENAKR